MRSTFALIPAVLAASALAAPWGPPGSGSESWGGEGYGNDDDCSDAPAGPTGSASHKPHSTVTYSTVSPTSTLQAIELAAHGTLPDGALPTKIADTTAITLDVVATVELFESAFFAELISNVTADKPGYQLKDNKDTVLADLKAIVAQEQLHATGANGILQTAGRAPIVPCKYDFPVNSYKEALAFISLQTDLVLGTLQEIAATVSSDGDAELINLFVSIAGQEGEQNGFFRSSLHKIPSALPFLSAASGAFTYSHINQQGIIAGSCPNGTFIANAGVPIFKPLDVVTHVSPATTEVEFSVSGSLPSNTSVVYINQQNTPKTYAISNIKNDNGKTTFTVPFPYNQFEMNGLTIAAVVNGAGNFASAGAVAMSTVFGPGLIEIN